MEKKSRQLEVLMHRQIAVFILLIILSTGCGSGPEDSSGPDGEGDRVVLTVGDREVTSQMLTPTLERMAGDSQMVNLKLQSIVNRLLILQDAFDRGFHSTRDMELYFYEREREKIQNDWLVYILNEKVQLPEDTVEVHYSQLGTMLLYTAITVPERALCDSLRELVQNGADMHTLAVENSIIPREVATGGVLGPIDRMDVFPNDYILLQGLEQGQLSGLDSSRSGWRFLRIDSMYQAAVPPLEEIAPVIEERILGRLKMVYKEHLFDSLRAVNNLQIIEGMPELMASHYTGNSQICEPFTSEQEDMAVYTFTGGSRTVYSLSENIRNLPPMGSNAPDDPEWIEGYCSLLGLYDIMAMEAKKLGMDTLPEVAAYMDQRFGNHVLDFYYNEVIAPRLVPTETELQDLYESERESLVIPEKRIFRTISALGDDQLELLERIIESGDDPFTHTDELTEVESLLAPGESVITRPIASADIPSPWSGMLFGMELNETVSCSVTTDRLLLFELMEITPEHAAAFDESIEMLSEIHRSAVEEEVISGLVDSLSSVYHIDIDSEFFDSFIYTDSITVGQ
jgi:hypothetical protein